MNAQRACGHSPTQRGPRRFRDPLKRGLRLPGTKQDDNQHEYLSDGIACRAGVVFLRKRGYKNDLEAGQFLETMDMAECVVCGAEVNVGADCVKGELVECGECGTELEVLSVGPVKLGEAPTEEEDWGQ